MKKIILAVVALVMALCTVSCNVIINTPDSGTSSETGEDTETVYPHSNMELAPLDDIIATSEHLSIPVSTFKYFFMNEYSTFINQYYYYLSYYNFDENIPLHDQDYEISETEKTTWYQIFLDKAKSSFEQYAKFAEMALKEGLTLDEADNAKIEENLKSIEEAAADYSQTFDEYMSQFMGEGMTRDRVKAAIEITQLGYKYYQKLYNEPTFTDEDIEKEYIDGKGEYSLVDFNEVRISSLYDETDSDEQISAAKNETKEKAEKMKELIENGTPFAEAYNTVMPAEETETETETDTDTVTEAETAEKEEETEDTTNKYLYTGVEYSSADAYKFLYEENTAEGQVNITYDDNGNATVVQCVKLPYKNTSRTVNMRHILLSSVDYDTEEEAYAMAQKLIEQINGAEDKKEKFLSFVPEYSSDTGSSTTGGLYENVMPGVMVTEINEWCFDSERKEGDIDIVKSDYGFHIVYLDSFGDEIWHYDCETALRDVAFSDKSTIIYDSVTFNYNEDLLDRITK